MQHQKFNSWMYHHTIDIPKRNAFHRHMHNEYEILYFVRGDADYIVEGAVYHLEPNDILLIRPRTFHCLIPRSDQLYERFVLRFSSDQIPEPYRPFIQNVPVIRNLSALSPYPAARSIFHFFEDWQYLEKSCSREELNIFLQHSFSSILLFLKQLPDDISTSPIHKNPTLSAILHYIDEHPWEQITAASLSEKFYMSSSWIIHIFRSELDVSLMQYVSKKRILYAQSLIFRGISPTEAAEQCGYDSYVTFYRQYRKILDKNPQQDCPEKS